MTTQRVALYFDGDQEWTFVDHRDEPETDEHDDVDYRFVVSVPSDLVTALDAAEKAEMAARRAIFDHVGFDAEMGQFVEPCAGWVGDEPLPARPFWEVYYRASGRSDEWPANGHDARLAAFDTEAEAVALVEALPEQFVSHHFGSKLQTLHRERLFIKHFEGWRGHRSRCHRCGHDYSGHPAEGAQP